jgi:hypothetical protein
LHKCQKWCRLNDLIEVIKLFNELSAEAWWRNILRESSISYVRKRNNILWTEKDSEHPIFRKFMNSCCFFLYFLRKSH